ncbi:MAG: hydantoinase/oxoprolinase family protein, partial [Alphaproteobacteria bacterium]|nr:hydantoinase/oxoprolinase family protein [Alphaproteobacteria bacterium]
MTRAQRYRIGVDIGGTFTDFALFDDETGDVVTHKQLTTPADPSAAVIEGVRTIVDQAGIAIGDVAAIVHGTTLVTNAVIERRGTPTAMLVTQGFRDTLDIGLERRYDLFDLRIRFPAPLVPRHLRFEVPERIKYDGTVKARPSFEALHEPLAAAIARDDVQAIAVCFLHSYLDPAHERAAAAWLAQRFPALRISTSSDVFPFMREFERWTTTCMNAYVQPVVDRYIARLEDGLAALGSTAKFLIMTSSGGTFTPALARRFPVRLLESGPAAGALMSARHGRTLGLDQVLSFDMGGTTAKGCIVRDAAPLKRYELEVGRVHEFKRGSGLPVKIPVLDMIEIGAGGGSLADVDERGVLRVGPRSAGAMPGPACYGQGGTLATLTDANLVLGYLDSGSFLGGRMRLDTAAARRAIETGIGRTLSVPVERAAWGIHEVINEDVARAFRVHASERGVDYRRCSMIAFGGSGPLHAVRVARKLKIPRVVCPTGAGVMSAFGLLTSPVGFELVRSRRVSLARLDAPQILGEFTALAAEADRLLGEAGVAAGEVTHRYRLDMRYEGQGYEIEVPVEGALDR